MIFKITMVLLILIMSITTQLFSQNTAAEANGLGFELYQGRWFLLPDFDSLKPTLTGVVSHFDIGFRPVEDYFAVRFQGNIRISNAGTYTFYLNSDDGSKLFIDDNLVVSNDGPHVVSERSGTVSLKAGDYPITVLYFEFQGDQLLEVSYKGPKIKKTLIPNEILFHSPKNGEPRPWQSIDIGKVSATGMSSYANGVFTIAASGADIWGTSDEFHYTYWPLNGNGEIISKVASISNSNAWAKAGLMIRETIRPDSKHAMICVTPTQGTAFQRRIETGGESTHTGGSGAAPIWLKLVRQETVFSAYTSKDSINWTLIDQEKIEMAANVLAGLAVTSHNDGTLCNATCSFNMSGAWGEIELTAEPTTIPADGQSQTKITSGPLIDFYYKPAKAGQLVSVEADHGKIIASSSTDISTGSLIKTDASGCINFGLQSDNEPGMATVYAQSCYGAAEGKTSVQFVGDDIKLITTASEKDKVSQGQENLIVKLRATNDGQATAYVKEVSLIMFRKDGTTNTDDFQITRNDTFSVIPVDRTREFSFKVNVNPDAASGISFIDGRLVSAHKEYVGVNQQHSWQVQTPPELKILSIEAVPDEVRPNQEELVVNMHVANQGEAAINTISAGLSFWQGSLNKSSEYVVQSGSDNPQVIEGLSEATLQFFVIVNFNATLGTIEINGDFSAKDLNSGAAYQSSPPEQTDFWVVKKAEGILINAIKPSQNYAVFNSASPWYIKMVVENKTGANLSLDSARVNFNIESNDVTSEYSITYPEQFLGSQSKSLKNNLIDSLQIDIGGFGASTGFLEITGHIYLREPGTSFSVEGSSTQGLVFITSEPEIQFYATEIDSCNNIQPETGNAMVNLGQRFSVKVAFRNLSDEDLEDIRISLNKNGDSYILEPAVQQYALLPKNSEGAVFFNIIANSSATPFEEKFTAVLENARGIKSQKQAELNLPSDVDASVTIQEPASLSVAVNCDTKARVGQIFDFTAKVTNPENFAKCDTNGTLSLILPSGYKLVTGKNIEGFEVNEADVKWQILAPASSQALDSIYVYISKPPRDLNSGNLAAIKCNYDAAAIETVESVLRITKASISSPQGAKDDTLSTGQYFYITARLDSEMVNDILFNLNLPDGYEYIDSTTVNKMTYQEKTWMLQAPVLSHAQPKKISVFARAQIQGDTTTIFSDPDTTIQAVVFKQTDLEVLAEITSPESAVQNGRITPGMELKIRGRLCNHGEAQPSGKGRLKLDIYKASQIDRESFSVAEDYELPVIGDSAVWTLKASEDLEKTIWRFVVSADSIPNDENTDTTAIMTDEAKVAEIVASSRTDGIGRLELVVKPIPNTTPPSIVPGETVTFMGLSLSNTAVEKEFPIRLTGMKLDILNTKNQLLFPSRVISGIRIKQKNRILGEASSIADNPVTFVFNPSDTINALVTDSVFIEVDLYEQIAESFKIQLVDSSYIITKAGVNVFVVREQGASSGSLNIQSSCPPIAPADLEASFCNFPNPFGSEYPKTFFRYYLSEDTNVELRIYTLLGALVWKHSYGVDSAQGMKGLHQAEPELAWDGKNMNYHSVLNGVYIAVLKTGTGKSAMTKVVYIK